MADQIPSTSLPEGHSGQPQGAAIAPQPAELNIPKWRFDDVVQQLRDTEAKLTKVSGELDIANKSKEHALELEKQIADLKKGYELEKVNAKRESAIEKAISDKAVDLEVVKKLIDSAKISFDDKDGVTGLEEQIKELQTNKPFLWKKAEAISAKASAASNKPEKTFAQKLAETKIAQVNVAAKAKNYFN